MADIDLLPPCKSIRAAAGADWLLGITVNFDASAATHICTLAKSQGGVALETFTDSDGIVVEAFVDGKTRAAITFPREITAKYVKEKLYLEYKIDISGAIRPYVLATIKVEESTPVA